MGILSAVAKITYPKNSLTKDEQKVLHGNFTYYIYFYQGENDYEKRMAQAWRPGARAEIYNVDITNKRHIISGRKRGEWI